jgi:hypothetical protein
MLNGWKSTVVVAGLAIAFGLPVGAVRAAQDPVKLRDREDNDEVPGIPREAKVVKEEKREAKFELPDKGQVWLYDVDSKKTLHSIALNKGDTYAFNSKEDHVYVNGREGEKLSLNADHTFRIYFVTAEARDAKNDRDRDRDRDKDRDTKRVVPDTAKKVMDGKDEEFSYKAEEDGMAYLWDNTNNKLIETFHLTPGDRLTISPKSNAMSVNGKTVSRDIELSRHVEYRLLWDVKK